MSTASVPLRVHHEGPVTRVVLDDPRRHNPQTPALWEALARAAAELPASTRVVVLSGNGPSFSAGLDRRIITPEGLAETFGSGRTRDRRAGVERRIAGFQQAFAAWREVPAVVLAAVHGHAIGAGFQLALAADSRIVADDVSFSMGEIHLGLVPDLGGTGRLVELVGPDRALEICLSGRRIDATEAVSLGLASMRVPADTLDASVEAVTTMILRADEHAVGELVPLLRGASRRTRAQQLQAERRAQSRLIARRLDASRDEPPRGRR